MKRRPIRPPTPELCFAAQVFNLHAQTALDGWRITAEQRQRELDRQEAEARQPVLTLDTAAQKVDTSRTADPGAGVPVAGAADAHAHAPC